MIDMHNSKVIIITGEKGDGKTTKLLKVVKGLINSGIQVIGFVAVAEWVDGKRNMYLLRDINSGQSVLLCTVVPTLNFTKHGRYYFNKDAIAFGQKILHAENSKESVVVIDEVGPFEIDSKVWHSSLLFHLNNGSRLIITVRKSLVDSIILKYKLLNVVIYNADEPERIIISEILK